MSFSLPFGKIAVIVIVAIVGYYIYSSMPASKTATNTNNAASQSAAPVGLSRTQYDQQRAGNFTNNIKDSPSLQAQKKHDEETKKLMQQASNSSQ